MFLNFLFIISFTLIGYLSIHAHISYIIYDLNALKVIQKMQVMNFM